MLLPRSFRVIYITAACFLAVSFIFLLRYLRPHTLSRVFHFPASTLNRSKLGFWGPSVPVPLVPVAIVVLPQSGQVLVWSADTASVFTNATTHTVSAIYDTASGVVTSHNVSATHHNMFCPGLSLDVSGRPVITGGSTPNVTSIFDAAQNNTWIQGPTLNTGRGYHAQATLSDGRIFTIGGSWSGDFSTSKAGEVLDPIKGIWTRLPQCVVEPMYTHDKQGVFAADNHPWLFAWRNNSVFQAGPAKSMNWYGVEGQGRHEPAGVRGKDGDAMNGNAVMYDAVAGKILTLGGAADYTESPASQAAHVITLSDAFVNKPKVDEINPMHHARAYANSVVLPTGNVLVTGGATWAKQWTDVNATMVPELWGHQTRKFIELARAPVPRTYHSVAILLPDATILTGGGGLCWDTCRGKEKEINHMDLQVYYPPYLFDRDQKWAKRPSILAVSDTRTRPGGSLQVRTSERVEEFAMLRYGSATHGINTDQRRIRLDGITLDRARSWHSYQVRVPDDPGVVLPGYWMLFAISDQGVPSVAETILVRAASQ